MDFIIVTALLFGADIPKSQEFDISGLLGFLITFFVVAYLIVTNVREALRLKKSGTPSHTRASSSKEKEDLEKLFEDFFETKNDEDEEESEALDLPRESAIKAERHNSLTPQTVAPLPQQTRWTQEADHFIFQSSIDDFKQKTKIEDRLLEINLRAGDELISKELKFAVGSQEKKAQKKEDALERLFKKHPAKVCLVVAAEIMRPPVGLRSLNRRCE
jgi:flagellar biosynthesis/type III secretory pathway M-ring protein FliF/YscJ